MLDLDLSLNAGATLALLGAGGGGGLQAFAFEAETTTLITAMTAASSAPTARRQKSMNWAIKTLKDAGVWSKLTAFWKVGADEPHSLINWKSPGTKDLVKTGAPTFAANVGYTGTTNNRLRTQINLTELNPATLYMGLWSSTAGNLGPSDFGALDVNGNGLSLNTDNGGFPVGRIGGGNVSPIDPTTTYWTGDGWNAVGRTDATHVTAYRGPLQKAITANATATLGSAEITLLGLNNNGTFGVSLRQQGGWAIGNNITAADNKIIASVMNQLAREFQYGEYDAYEPGYLPATATYDVIVYGATSGGAIAAYEAARQGLSVAIVGGWRDRTVGGMTAQGGLGLIDWDVKTALGGLPRWLLGQIQTAMGVASTVFAIDPAVAGQVFRGMLDPRITGGRDIPVYWSTGVVSCTKTGTVVNTITTADGRTFTANTGFIDASYEGDLIAAAGCTVTVGREAAGSGKEAINGFRGTATTLGGSNQQFVNHAGTLVNIDPWITPGNTGSGLLSGLSGIMGTDTPAVGSADARVQAYTFRITDAGTAGWRVPFSSSAPPNYSAARYEALGRLFAADATLTLDDILKIDTVRSTPNVVHDINNRNGLSIDLTGGSAAYAASSYTAREAIWKDHENYIRGLFYYLQYEADARIPAGVRTSALATGLSMQHYTRPHPNDDYNWMPQLYVREAYRLVGDYVHNANDIAATDGTTPRSVKTIAVASYTIDSHRTAAWAHNNAGTWRIWHEGGLADSTSGGNDDIAPIPMEVVLPKVAEVTNIASVFAVSATHVAVSSIRMEFSHMLMGQAAACMMAERKANANVALQSLDYTNLRTRLLATPSLTGEVAPSLPQLN
jgi:hypothetical protein